MQNTHPVKLQIISLTIEEQLGEDLECSVSLMKGLHNFGEITFVFEKKLHQVQFQPVKIITFYYTPRFISRKDVFFKIILIDIENSEQIGEILVSTHMLAETFGKKKEAVIEKTQEFYPGIKLHYKIYPPKFEIRRQQKIGFKKVEMNDLVSTIFNMNPPTPKKTQNKVEKQKAEEKNIFSFFTSLAKQKQKQLQGQKKEEQEDQLFSVKISESKIKKEQDLLERQKNEWKKPEQSDTPIGLFTSLVVKNQNMKESSHSLESAKEAQQFLGKTFGFLRQSTFQQKKKKHTLMPAHQADHHQIPIISLKLKIVIFLLIFGVFMMCVDFLGDRSELNKKQVHVSKPKSKPKAKKKKNNKAEL